MESVSAKVYITRVTGIENLEKRHFMSATLFCNGVHLCDAELGETCSRSLYKTYPGSGIGKLVRTLVQRRRLEGTYPTRLVVHQL